MLAGSQTRIIPRKYKIYMMLAHEYRVQRERTPFRPADLPAGSVPVPAGPRTSTESISPFPFLSSSPNTLRRETGRFLRKRRSRRRREREANGGERRCGRRQLVIEWTDATLMLSCGPDYLWGVHSFDFRIHGEYRSVKSLWSGRFTTAAWRWPAAHSFRWQPCCGKRGGDSDGSCVWRTIR